MTKAQLIAIATILGIAGLATLEAAISNITPGAMTTVEGVWVEHRLVRNDNLGPKHVTHESRFVVDGHELTQAWVAAEHVTRLVVAQEIAVSA